MNKEVFTTHAGDIILCAKDDEDREVIEYLRSLHDDILYDGEVKKAEVIK